ncbi:hypothetical protein [Aquisphaera giovannonii]|uniref:hypothetical protein n=1 Tax=Aquisphaera giovannonii TaxID=406548 RepID=UPI001AEFEE60|nr:hypothetical protein [Aquisphaera giovannonii]
MSRRSPAYQIDGRVSIALDALDERQRRAVGAMIANRDRFLESTSDPSRIRKISRTRPLYALEAPDGLRVIYSHVGDEIVVMDLMHQATLDQFRRKTSLPNDRRVKGEEIHQEVS